jgi:3-hydroxyisobutyrate dehydrogenase-like beta-hydroxyacid dehydrogenase
LIQRRAAAANVPLVHSQQELAARSDVILGVTPGSASIESAEAFAPHLAPRHVFVDLASATPKVKQLVGSTLASSKAQFADTSIMGTPHVDGHRLPILASGVAAERFRDLLSPWGLKIEPVAGDLGAASGIKILRSVIAKGLEALLVECVIGARRYGIDEAVLKSFGMAIYSNYRVRRLGLDGVFDFMFSPRDHDIPESISVEDLSVVRLARLPAPSPAA